MLDKPNLPAFRVGERVFYPGHGVGTIRAVSEEKILDFEIRNYAFELDTGGTVKVPVEKAVCNGMRAAGSEDALRQVIKILRKGPEKFQSTGNSRYLKECLSRLKTGDLMEIATVIRDLYRRDGFLPGQFAAKHMSDCAFTLLLPEIAAITKKTLMESFDFLVCETGKEFDYKIGTVVLIPDVTIWAVGNYIAPSTENQKRKPDRPPSTKKVGTPKRKRAKAV